MRPGRNAPFLVQKKFDKGCFICYTVRRTKDKGEKKMFEKIMEKIAEVRDISYLFDLNGNKLTLVVEDFEGFDEEGNVVFADLDEFALTDLLNWLDENSDDSEKEFFDTWTIGGFEVEMEYASTLIYHL